MIIYVLLGFVLGVAATIGVYCWVYAHADRVCDAIEAAAREW